MSWLLKEVCCHVIKYHLATLCLNREGNPASVFYFLTQLNKSASGSTTSNPVACRINVPSLKIYNLQTDQLFESTSIDNIEQSTIILQLRKNIVKPR